jgi:hypothetical protein
MDSLFEKCKKLTNFKMSILRRSKTASLEWEKGTGRWKGGVVRATAKSSNGRKIDDNSSSKEAVCVRPCAFDIELPDDLFVQDWNPWT